VRRGLVVELDVMWSARRSVRAYRVGEARRQARNNKATKTVSWPSCKAERLARCPIGQQSGPPSRCGVPFEPGLPGYEVDPLESRYLDPHVLLIVTSFVSTKVHTYMGRLKRLAACLFVLRTSVAACEVAVDA
jgi:hypothetical protein